VKHAWFNCGAGVAGDMVLGALVDAGADPLFIADVLGHLDVDDYALTFERTQRCGISSTQAIVAVHHHGDTQHHHRHWRDIRTLIETSSIPDAIEQRSLSVFEHLAIVESRIHGVSVDDVEFHEVGSTDAIVDIVGVCAAMASLGVEHVSCSPIAIGHGLVTAAHGALPNPAPAVAHLLADHRVPVVGLDDDRELSTPTGVAVMVAFAQSFGPMPTMTPAAVGYGAGSRDRPGRANVVSVLIGETSEQAVVEDQGRKVTLFETNVDDISGEVVAHTISRLLDAGAHDAWATPIIMKKGRPAFTVHVLCEQARADRIAELLVRETGTLGLRGTTLDRWPQQRTESIVVVDGHEIRVKLNDNRVKVEFDDAARAAQALGVPVRTVIEHAQNSVS
jgi:uncharacterized protein (TIGR00299 family) protein